MDTNKHSREAEVRYMAEGNWGMHLDLIFIKTTEEVVKLELPFYDSSQPEVMKQIDQVHAVVNTHIEDIGGKGWIDTNIIVSGVSSLGSVGHNIYHNETRGMGMSKWRIEITQSSPILPGLVLVQDGIDNTENLTALAKCLSDGSEAAEEKILQEIKQQMAKMTL